MGGTPGGSPLQNRSPPLSSNVRMHGKVHMRHRRNRRSSQHPRHERRLDSENPVLLPRMMLLNARTSGPNPPWSRLPSLDGGAWGARACNASRMAVASTCFNSASLTASTRAPSACGGRRNSRVRRCGRLARQKRLADAVLDGRDRRAEERLSPKVYGECVEAANFEVATMAGR